MRIAGRATIAVIASQVDSVVVLSTLRLCFAAHCVERTLRKDHWTRVARAASPRRRRSWCRDADAPDATSSAVGHRCDLRREIEPIDEVVQVVVRLRTVRRLLRRLELGPFLERHQLKQRLTPRVGIGPEV